MDVEHFELALERTSKSLFGSGHRLRLWCALATLPEDFSMKELRLVTPGIPPSRLSEEVSRLCALGLLERRRDEFLPGAVRFTRTPSQLWTLAVEIGAEIKREQIGPAMAKRRRVPA